MKCEVCNSSNTFPFLDLGKQPLCDDLIKINSNKKCKKYTSKIYFCNTCYTAFHKTKVKPSKLFPKKLDEIKILEFGCGTGWLTNSLMYYYNKNL